MNYLNEDYTEATVPHDDDRRVDAFANLFLYMYSEKNKVLTPPKLYSLILHNTDIEEPDLKSLKAYFRGREHRGIYDYIQSEDSSYYFAKSIKLRK